MIYILLYDYILTILYDKTLLSSFINCEILINHILF